MTTTSRTDRILTAIHAEIEEQRAAIDAGTPLTSVTVFVHLHPSGDVRNLKFRADRQRETPEKQPAHLLANVIDMDRR